MDSPGALIHVGVRGALWGSLLQGDPAIWGGLSSKSPIFLNPACSGSQGLQALRMLQLQPLTYQDGLLYPVIPEKALYRVHYGDFKIL